MAWVSTLHSTTQYKKNRIKLLNRKLEIENEVAENEIPNEIKLKLKIMALVLLSKVKYGHKIWVLVLFFIEFRRIKKAPFRNYASISSMSFGGGF